MEYLAKQSFSFLQDFAFISINIETFTNKWNISRKSRFLFCKILHLLVLTMKHVLINGTFREKVFSFWQDFASISINTETCPNKWNISRKSRFLFCKILHLLVVINGISCKKVVFFFARFCIY